MLHRIANKYNFAGLWKEDMDKISYCSFTFGNLLTQYVPEVKAKLVLFHYSPFIYLILLNNSILYDGNQGSIRSNDNKQDETSIPTMAYTAQFFITGFLYSLPFHFVVRVWDSLLARDFDYMYSIGISIFSLTRGISSININFFHIFPSIYKLI